MKLIQTKSNQPSKILLTFIYRNIILFSDIKDYPQQGNTQILLILIIVWEALNSKANTLVIVPVPIVDGSDSETLNDKISFNATGFAANTKNYQTRVEAYNNKFSSNVRNAVAASRDDYVARQEIAACPNRNLDRKKRLQPTRNKIIQHLRIYAFAVLTLAAIPQVANADLTITPSTNSTSIGTSLTGLDVTISNVTITQGTIGNQSGLFTGGGTGGVGPLLGIEDGVVLVTGDVDSADGPNTSISTTTGGETGPTDTSLSSIETGTQFDTIALEFNVVPAGNTLGVNYLFASEEYNEFVCTTFNDAMGIFISGPGITGEVNIARLDSNLANFSINEINGGVAGSASASFPASCNLDNAEFFVDNITNTTNPTETPYSANTASPTEVQNNYTNVEYDGFMTPVEAQLQVQPGQTYSIKIVTADIGDSQWDGAVFIDAVNSYDLDYGDAPDSYGTSSVDQTIQLPGPARHSTGSSIYLGSVAPDAEGNGTPTTSPNAANGDDNTGDDEDAFSSDLVISSGTTSHTISDIPVNNTSSQTAQLMGWIDFNQDGDFLDAGEQAVVDVVPNQTTANLNWSGFPATTSGNTYARFRITTDSDLINSPSPVGLALDGEVEDYEVTIADFDYGDAPDAYGDASHQIPASPSIYLGSIAPDSEGDTQLGTDAGAAAAGDDNDGGDDEDAFTALGNVSITGNYSLDVPLTNTSGDNATLHAWIDFNQNDVFEANEYQSATVNNNDTNARLNWTVPTGAVVGDTHARFRITSNSGLSDDDGTNIDERSVGNTSDGEVEDYLISMIVPIYDYGDAPDTGTGTGTGNYQTIDSDGGAAQVVLDEVGQILSLGSAIDVDDGSLQDSNAEADDNEGTPNDEDGVSSFPTLTTAEGQTYTVSVIANNNVPLEDAYLVGYIDFNQDGDFEDTGEQSTTVTVPTSTSNPRTFDVTFTTPAGMTTGTTYARFRLGQVQATAEQATGASISTDNGEIEDYSLEIAEIDGNRPLGFPFTCDSTFYITIGQGGTNPQFLYRVNRAGDTFVFDEIGSSTSSANGYPTTFRYNALAYNPVDNYLYGYIQGSSAATGPYAVGNVVQIGSNGVLHSIGIPTDGSGGTLPLNSYYAASMLSDGTYVIGRGSDFAKLDVTTSPPTILSTGSISGASFTDFAVDPTDPTSLSGGRIYGINESGSSDRLVILDVTGNNPTIVSQATNPTGNNHNAGSQFVDSFGTLYYRSNSDAKLYRVDSDATSATYGVATEITTAPTGGSHDGASCLFASVMEKEVQDLDGNLITTSPAGEVVNYVYRIASGNVLDISGVTFEDDLRNVTGGDPINGTFNGNFTVSNGSGTVSFSNSNQTIQISDLIIPAQTLATSDSDIVTITAEVEVPNSLTTGEYLNQAFISNLPAQYPSLISSDYPASAAYEDPTPLQVTEPLASDPELTLVKRITAINPGQPEREILFNEYVDDGVADNADNEPNWLGSQPSPDGNTNTYTLGAIDGGQVQPGDVIEYTIYFLSHGDGTAENVLVCDLIPENTEFLVHDFDTLPGSAGGVAGSDRGLAWEYNGATESLTNGSDGDGGYYFVPGVEPTSIADLSSVQCGATNLPNTNGAVVVNLANLSPATAPGVPTDSYGLIRFRVRVQ